MNFGFSEEKGKAKTMYAPAMDYVPEEIRPMVESIYKSALGGELPTSVPITYGGSPYNVAALGPLRYIESLMGAYRPIPTYQKTSGSSMGMSMSLGGGSGGGMGGMGLGGGGGGGAGGSAAMGGMMGGGFGI